MSSGDITEDQIIVALLQVAVYEMENNQALAIPASLTSNTSMMRCLTLAGIDTTSLRTLSVPTANNLVTLTSATLTERTNDGTIYPQSAESQIYDVNFKIDNSAKAGDTFTLVYDKNTVPTDYDIANWKPVDITDATGEVIATGQYDVATDTILYTFTNYVDRYENVTANITSYSYIDSATVSSNTTLTLNYSLGGESISVTKKVIYNTPTINNYSSQQSFINNVDYVNNTVEKIIYVNTLN